MKWLWLMVGIALASPLRSAEGNANPASGATYQVTLTNGQSLGGALRIEQGRLLFKAQAGEAERPLALAEIRRIYCAEAPEELYKEGWAGLDLGKPPENGAYRFQQQKLIACGSGVGLQGKRDAHFFMHQDWERSVEMIVCIQEWGQAGGPVIAGLMMSERLTINAPHFAVLADSNQRLELHCRARARSNSVVLAQNELAAPVWLKLKREGSLFSASYSADGNKWILLGSQSLGLPDKLKIGLVVAGGEAGKAGEVVCRSLTLKGLSVVDFKPLLVLRSGSEIPSAVYSGDDTRFKFVRAQRDDLTVPTRNVAYLLYQPLTTNLAGTVHAGRSGVLMRNGDFMEGEIKSVTPTSVTVSSLLFGLREIKLATAAVAVVLRPVTPSASAWEIRLRDGSKILGGAVRALDDRLVVTESALGEFSLPLEDLLECERR